MFVGVGLVLLILSFYSNWDQVLRLSWCVSQLENWANVFVIGASTFELLIFEKTTLRYANVYPDKCVVHYCCSWIVAIAHFLHLGWGVRVLISLLQCCFSLENWQNKIILLHPIYNETLKTVQSTRNDVHSSKNTCLYVRSFKKAGHQRCLWSYTITP